MSEEAGLSRRSAPITTGLPFAAGVLRTNDLVRLVNEQGTEIPLQSQVTATWRDGSVRWLLLDFQADGAPRETRTYQLELGVPPTSEAPAPRIRIQDHADRVVVDTGPLQFAVLRHHFGLLAPTSWDRNQDRQFAPEEVVAAGLDFDYATSQPGAASASARTTHRRIPATPREVTIEEPGPLRSVIRVAGTFESAPGASALPSGEGMEYVVRIHAFAGSATVRIVFTAVRLGGEPGILPVKRLATTLRLAAPEPERDVAQTQPAGPPSASSVGSPVQVRVGGFPEAIAKLGAGTREIVQLDQLDEEQASLRLPGQSEIIGPRAPGWLGWQQANRSVLLVHHHFWQQFPKSFVANTTELVSELWPAAVRPPFDWDAGLAKTHEFWIDFAVPNPGTDTAYEVCSARARSLDSPLRAVAAPEHYCGSGTFGALHPFDFDRFPEYETFVTAGADILLRRMATGFRHWGDYYYGGEFKGTNAFMNLEYDVHHNFLLQFARTGLRKYLEAAVTMAGHQSDIDTNHRTGWQWKHSPRHVETRAEFGHTFTRGLLEAWHLTGERRFLETARKLGDAFTEQIRDPRQLGNERQIGWALISLLPVYEATWDPKYFHAASNTVERLLSGLDARGRFAIRWDNRIAFFNGIAATGFLYYYRATGDERVADAILRVIRRTRGMYPEYAGRTLEAIAWACERENQPEDLELLARTFEATMAWQLDWSILAPGASTIFTVHALPFLAATGVARPLDLPMNLSASQFAGDHRHPAHRIPVGEADLFLEAADAEPFDVLVLRQGAWKSDASARFTGPAGSEVGRLEFPRAATVWQQQHLKVSNAKAGSYRIELRAPNLPNSRGGFWVSWDVVTSRPMRAVLQCPGFQGLEWLTPTLCAVPQPGANRIHLELAAEGEGFKKVVLLDPAGNIAASSTGFIDLGDRTRHRYRVTAEIPPEHRSGIWQFILQDVTLTRLEGLVPRFSTSPEAFFP